MATHTATVEWKRENQVFLDNRYSRSHVWRFDGDVQIAVSSSAQHVPIPFAEPESVEPEKAFVAALSSSHMLWFLGMAARQGYRVDHYSDKAECLMEHGAAGKEWITALRLSPHVVFSGPKLPNDPMLQHIHRTANAECHLANSVLGEVQVNGTWAYEANA